MLVGLRRLVLEQVQGWARWRVAGEEGEGGEGVGVGVGGGVVVGVGGGEGGKGRSVVE